MSIILDARSATDHFPGIGRYVVHLAAALTPLLDDHRLSLLVNPASPSGRLRLPDLPVVACAASPFSLRQQWLVPRALRQHHTTLYHSPYYLMPYRPGAPSVLTCYDMIPLVCPEYFGARQRLIFRLAHGLALASARIVLAISESTRADVVRLFRVDPAKVMVTPLAAEAHFQPQPPERIAAVRRRYGLPEDYVLSLGSNKPHKNIVRLVEAWGSLNAAPAILVIAGPWDARYPEAKRLVEQRGWHDRVRFIGVVAEIDLAALYSGAQLFAFPSLYEGFGLPVIEAMACGTPVVCSSAPALREVAAEAALLFDPKNPDALAQTLQRVLGDAGLRAGLRDRGLRRAKEFSWARTAHLTAQAYERVIGR